MKHCEKCGKQESRYARIEYSEDMDQLVCGTCEQAFEDSLEEYEERRQRRLQESNEY